MFRSAHAVRPVVEVQRKLRGAADEQLAQVVALVDAMPVRGAADALIAPLRARLAAIEPLRPLSITRLLFRPLDPVIVTGPRWRPGIPAVPRTALSIIGHAVIGQLGTVATSLQASIAGRDGKEHALANQVGASLWPVGAKVVAQLPTPAGWGAETGLPESCYPEIRASVAAVLHQAVPLTRWTRDAGASDPAPAVNEILHATQAAYPAGFGVVLAILLADGTTAAPALLAASAMPGVPVDPAVIQTLDRAQHLLTAVLPSAGLAAASAQAAHVAALLDAVEAPGARPGLRGHAQRVREQANEACQSRLVQALDQDFLPKLAATGAELDDAAVEGLENDARGLRRLAMAGRRFGAAATYDKLLGRTAAGACASASSTLTRMERLRLAELLIGTEAALRLPAA